MDKKAGVHHCHICFQRQAWKRCSGCQTIWYCSRECQKKDRPVHAPRCKPPAWTEDCVKLFLIPDLATVVMSYLVQLRVDVCSWQCPTKDIEVQKVAWADNVLIASDCGDQSLLIFYPTGETKTLNESFECFAAHRDSIYVLNDDGELKRYNTQLVLMAISACAHRDDMDVDAKYVVLASLDGYVELFGARDLRHLRTFSLQNTRGLINIKISLLSAGLIHILTADGTDIQMLTVMNRTMGLKRCVFLLGLEPRLSPEWVIYNDEIIVHDREQRVVVAFSMDGVFLRQRAFGGSMFYNFCVDKNTNQLWIVDADINANKIYVVK